MLGEIKARAPNKDKLPNMDKIPKETVASKEAVTPKKAIKSKEADQSDEAHTMFKNAHKFGKRLTFNEATEYLPAWLRCEPEPQFVLALGLLGTRGTSWTKYPSQMSALLGTRCPSMQSPDFWRGADVCQAHNVYWEQGVCLKQEVHQGQEVPSETKFQPDACKNPVQEVCWAHASKQHCAPV